MGATLTDGHVLSSLKSMCAQLTSDATAAEEATRMCSSLSPNTLRRNSDILEYASAIALVLKDMRLFFGLARYLRKSTSQNVLKLLRALVHRDGWPLVFEGIKTLGSLYPFTARLTAINNIQDHCLQYIKGLYATQTTEWMSNSLGGTWDKAENIEHGDISSLVSATKLYGAKWMLKFGVQIVTANDRNSMLATEYVRQHLDYWTVIESANEVIPMAVPQILPRLPERNRREFTRMCAEAFLISHQFKHIPDEGRTWRPGSSHHAGAQAIPRPRL
ncbi:hypothetical protein EJ08DRAFT_464915 [Tothia fuscella]|uniref:Uncharacterized protein n=1 Tax=Tothia fuscella TaxID=1048955 RepID=A0A9P4P0C4_9PEZI|nr:hypothetical protein EJ08DRAFT_464915 [Tothia fuscella]